MSTSTDLRESPAYDSRYAIVVPTIGRPSLQRCVDALAAASGPLPQLVVVVDDRPDTPDPLPLEMPQVLADRIAITMTSGGRGPAAARNAGWRAVPATVPWIVFLDDDVEVEHFWRARLDRDLCVAPEIGAVQGVIHVPLPSARKPTDWERNVAGLADASWITADMAYRRDALVETGGFDERFGRAFREDADLALRVQDAGWRLTVGQRRTRHPVRPADRWVSVRMQAGNADDVLMARLHGRDWYDRAQAARGARGRHLAVTALGAAALGATALGATALAAGGVRGGQRGSVLRRTGSLAAAGWFAGTAAFFAERVLPGPRTADELATMALSSVAIPPAATAHWLRGLRRYRRVRPESWPGRPLAVLFDRDGTLVRDVPYNTDPSRVEPMPTAVEALRLLRDAGLRIGVVTNQSGIGRGLITPAQAKEVDEQVIRLLGPFDAWAVCPHTPEDGCDCRKPRPGLVYQAAAELGVRPEDCIVVGDIGADVGAARAAGSRSVLIPTPRTRIEELAGARIATDLLSAARWIAGQGDPGRASGSRR